MAETHFRGRFFKGYSPGPAAGDLPIPPPRNAGRTLVNSYAGTCRSCKAEVAAGAGVVCCTGRWWAAYCAPCAARLGLVVAGGSADRIDDAAR